VSFILRAYNICEEGLKVFFALHWHGVQRMGFRVSHLGYPWLLPTFLSCMSFAAFVRGAGFFGVGWRVIYAEAERVL